MTQEQKAAFIQAQTALCNGELAMMQAENAERERHGQALAHGPEQFLQFLQRWEPILGYNALIGFFNS